MDAPSYYAIIPANVRYSAITPNAKLLYGEITALASKSGVCWATNKYFASLYGTSIRTVQRWLYELHDNGFVVICEAPSGARGMRLPVPVVRDDKSVMPPDKPVMATHDKNVTHNNTRVNNNESIPPTPKGEPDGFKEFWDAYPNKVKKPKAMEMWKRLKADHADVMAGLRRWKTSEQWTKDNGRFIPHPTSWLNAEGWNDIVPGQAAPISASDIETQLRKTEEAGRANEAMFEKLKADRRRQLGLSE